MEALRGMLSIHLHPREQEPDAEMGQEGRVEREQKHSQDSIVGTPRVLTQEQVSVPCLSVCVCLRAVPHF